MTTTPEHREKVGIYTNGDDLSRERQKRLCWRHAERHASQVITEAEEAPGERRRWIEIRRLRKEGVIDHILIADRRVIPPPDWLDIVEECEQREPDG
jgi:SpoVK/Ycf46/Vps4 family AAA+-type ATPase